MTKYLIGYKSKYDVSTRIGKWMFPYLIYYRDTKTKEDEPLYYSGWCSKAVRSLE